MMKVKAEAECEGIGVNGELKRGDCKGCAGIDALGKLILRLRHLRGWREANKLVEQAYIELGG
jgi:hypothetical protein